MGQLVTGVDFVAATVLVMRIADGKLAHMRDYTDNLTIAQGLGRIPDLARRRRYSAGGMQASQNTGRSK